MFPGQVHMSTALQVTLEVELLLYFANSVIDCKKKCYELMFALYCVDVNFY